MAVAIGNGGPSPSASNPVPATAVTTGVFGGSGTTTLPGALAIVGAVTGATTIAMTGGLSGATTGAFSGNVTVATVNSVPVAVGQGSPATVPGFYCGVGVPTFSAANSSKYLRFDGTTGSTWYANTSGASTAGTTWSAQLTP